MRTPNLRRLKVLDTRGSTVGASSDVVAVFVNDVASGKTAAARLGCGSTSGKTAVAIFGCGTAVRGKTAAAIFVEADFVVGSSQYDLLQLEPKNKS